MLILNEGFLDLKEGILIISKDFKVGGCLKLVGNLKYFDVC